MSHIEPNSTSSDYVYIDLDPPTPWWGTLVGIIAVALITSVLIGPWLIQLDNDEPEVISRNTLQNTSSLCRPDANGLPSFLNPTVASWSRFCDWFIAPEVNPQGDSNGR